MNLKINEIFYSIQGEGARAGQPSIFIRLADCNLTCNFCDTEFVSYTNFNCEDLSFKLDKIRGQCNWIVWTGGEPALQLTEGIIAFFKSLGYKQAIETNGSKPIPPGLDWVCVSPKVAEHVLEKNFPNGVDELKYVVHTGRMTVPNTNIKASHYYLSPEFNGNKINQENLQHCIKLCLENPKWGLSVQTHKLWRVL